MTCSKSAANVLGLSKQDNTNDTFAADVEEIIADDAGQIIM